MEASFLRDQIDMLMLFFFFFLRWENPEMCSEPMLQRKRISNFNGFLIYWLALTHTHLDISLGIVLFTVTYTVTIVLAKREKIFKFPNNSSLTPIFIGVFTRYRKASESGHPLSGPLCLCLTFQVLECPKWTPGPHLFWAPAWLPCTLVHLQKSRATTRLLAKTHFLSKIHVQILRWMA